MNNLNLYVVHNAYLDSKKEKSNKKIVNTLEWVQKKYWFIREMEVNMVWSSQKYTVKYLSSMSLFHYQSNRNGEVKTKTG